MPENLKVLRGRIRSIGQTRKITRAMEMVSAAKLRKTESVMKASRPFLEKIEQLLSRLAQSTWAETHPLFKKSEDGFPLLVIFTSDRGLCGAFNANLMKRAVVELRKNPAMKVFVIGRKGRDWMRRYAPHLVVDERVDFGGLLDGKVTDAIGQQLLDGFRDGHFSRIELCYPHFVSMMTNVPTVQRYLPLDATAFGSAGETRTLIDYILEPTPERVFDAILPRYLKSKIFLTLAETLTSEHSARRMAMNNATKNCDDLGSQLTLRLNKARQAAITTEIIEIVSGANALEG